MGLPIAPPQYSTRIKDAGIAIRHSRGYTFFYTAGSRNGLEGVGGHGPGHKILRKRDLLLIEKYIEDARQDEKHVPDLLESIIQPPGLVKEELRQKLFKMNQIRSKIAKMGVSKFWIPEIQNFPAGGQHNLLAQ